MKVNAIHRGLVHLMATSAVLSSERALARWADRHEVSNSAEFSAVIDEAVGGREIDLPPAGRRLLAEIERLLDGRVRRGRAADRIDSRGRRVVLGLFAAYHADPVLLEDHVLLRFKELAGVRFLRDLPRGGVEDEIHSSYRGDARFARLLCDHLASMTDAYALSEHARLLEMGAVPIPSAEQLRRERFRDA